MNALDPVEREYLVAIKAASRDPDRALELSIALDQYRKLYKGAGK